MCTGIARYYIKVAHLFAAINKTVNPMISWKTVDGRKQLTPVMNKADVPKGVKTTLSKLNFCTQRIAAIKPIHNTDQNILIKAKNCNMNIKTDNIQAGGGEESSTGFFENIANKANSFMDNTINSTKEIISNTTEKTKDVLSNVTEKSKNLANNVISKAESIKDSPPPPPTPTTPHLITAKTVDSDSEEEKVDFMWDDYHKDAMAGSDVITEDDDWDDWDDEDDDGHVVYVRD